MKSTYFLKAWMLLLFTVLAEALATSMLKYSNGFQHIAFGFVSFGIYIMVLFLFSHVLAHIPASIAYTIWAGLGTLLLIISGWLFFDEVMTYGNLIGISLIITGVIFINKK